MRRFAFSRRTVYALGAVASALLIVGLAFGPLVRSRVSAEAARRHLDVRVGRVRPGWFAVRLLDVSVSPEGVDEVRIHASEVRVDLSAALHVDGVAFRGGEVVLRGSIDVLRDRLRTWRERSAPAGGASGRVLPVVGESWQVEWIDGESPEPRARLAGLAFSRDAERVRASVAAASVRAAAGAIELADASTELDSNGLLARAHARSVRLELPVPERPAPSPPLASDSASAAAVGPRPRSVLSSAGSRDRRRANAVTSPAPDPAAPLLPLPELHAVRGKAAALATLLGSRVAVGAEATVESMTVSLPQGEQRVAFTIGPGPLAVTRTPARFEMRFSTDTRTAGPSLGVRIALPTEQEDVSATLEGGPVSLSLLGIHEGAGGLVDVNHATVTGKARVALAGDGSELTFDAELGARDLSLHQPKIAADVVRGVDLDFRIRGAMNDAGLLRLDEFAGAIGVLHVAGSGTLAQEADHVSGSLRFEVATAACQGLLDSTPTALLPVLQATKMTGTFGARGYFAFDTRSLDDLTLDYHVQDDCRVSQVPQNLARDRFKQPFVHKVYLPDGDTTEQMTGAGTDNWTPLSEISPYMQIAVLTTEDGAFFHHRGFNHAAIRASIIANLKVRRFVRGASTITMQLAKNLFLSRDKTLSRKLEEVVLTDYLEQTFSKDELMELYLNVIEFGPAVYGITSAAEYYFGRSPSELNLAESLFLASLLPAPLNLGAMRDGEQVPEGFLRTLRNLMQIEEKRGLITDAELTEAQDEPVVFWHGGPRPAPRPAVQVPSRSPKGEADDANGGAGLPVDPDAF
jgi:hypothetical protein